MVANRDDYVKAKMDQQLSNRKTHEIIAKEEAGECLLEARNSFVEHIYRKGIRIAVIT